MNTDDEGGSGGLWVFDSVERICKASSTRNCAGVSSIFKETRYNFHRRGRHRKGETRDLLETVVVRDVFLEKGRGCHLEVEVLQVVPVRGLLVRLGCLPVAPGRRHSRQLPSLAFLRNRECTIERERKERLPPHCLYC